MYNAIYYPYPGQPSPATVIVTPVTISILLEIEGERREVYWLADELLSYEELPAEVVLQYRSKQGVTERLVIKDQSLIDSLKRELRHHRLVNKSIARPLGHVWVKLGVLFGIIVALLLAAYFWWIPALGERMANRFSKEQEINMGDKMYASLASSFQVDAEKTAAVNAFYKQLHYPIDYPIAITVVKADITNAFAVPGGHIVVYDAILDQMKTPEELAALLAHEASHIALRHSLRNMFRSLARSMFLSLFTGNEGGLAAVAINRADDLKGLQYSRALETEADNNGLRLMSQSHIDVRGMEWLMMLLQKESGDQEPNSLLSTHPVFKDRIANIQQQLKQLPAGATSNPALKTLFHAIYE